MLTAYTFSGERKSQQSLHSSQSAGEDTCQGEGHTYSNSILPSHAPGGNDYFFSNK